MGMSVCCCTWVVMCRQRPSLITIFIRDINTTPDLSPSALWGRLLCLAHRNLVFILPSFSLHFFFCASSLRLISTVSIVTLSGERIIIFLFYASSNSLLYLPRGPPSASQLLHFCYICVCVCVYIIERPSSRRCNVTKGTSNGERKSYRNFPMSRKS